MTNYDKIPTHLNRDTESLLRWRKDADHIAAAGILIGAFLTLITLLVCSVI